MKSELQASLSKDEQARQEFEQIKSQLEAMRNGVNQLRLERDRVQDQLDEIKGQLEGVRRELEFVRKEAGAHAVSLNDLRQELDTIINSLTWRNARFFLDRVERRIPGFKSFAGFAKCLGRWRQERKEVRLIKKSGLFDKDFYLRTCPDVAQAKIDPIRHYVRHGWKEARNPSRKFDTGFYLTSNPDVAAKGMNPLVHYALHGRGEGKLPKSHDQNLFFLHVPKTAGSSLRASLSAVIEEEKLRFVSTPKEHEQLLRISPNEIRKLCLMGGHVSLQYLEKILKKEERLNWKIFSVIREPYKRSFSMFNFLVNSNHPDHEVFHELSIDQYFSLFSCRKIKHPFNMCWYFSAHGTYQAANEMITRYNICMYTLEMDFNLLLLHLSEILGKSIILQKTNVGEYQHTFDQYVDELKKYPLLTEQLEEDEKLYKAVLNHNYRRLL